MITRETKVIHTTDRFMKVIFTLIVVCLVWLSVKNTPMEPVVTAQGGIYTHGGVFGNPIRIQLNCSGC